MKTFTAIFVCLLFMSGLASAQSQPRSGGFAAVQAPGQPTAPGAVTPQPAAPQPPGVARPTTPTQSTSQQPQEQLRIVADPATNSLIIYGTAQEFQNIKNILKELDAVPRQVLLDVVVAEVTLTDDESFGIAYEISRGNTAIFNRTFPSGGAVVGAVDARSLAADAITAALTGFAPGISGIIGRSNVIRAYINALATQNRIKALASPSVLAMDNRPARIQVGSEIPILSGTSQSTIANSQVINSVQYRNTGVILTIIPQVNSQGLVNLQVKQEVSDVGSNSFGNTNSPSFTTRDAETTAVIQDGETLAIGGIIAERKTRDRSGIPYLMDLPVLGRFFGTTSDHSTRTELVILITPHVIRNIDESRFVTQELKNRLSDVRNELERWAREREKTQPRPSPQQLPSMPDPNQFYQEEAPQPAPSVQPGRGASSPSTTPSSGSAIVFPDPVEGRADERAGNKQVPKRNNDVAAPNAQGFALSLVPARSEAAPAPVNKTDERSVNKANRFWAVQVAALAENKDAESLAEKLRQEGYQAYVLTNHADDKTWHRVRVGRFVDQNGAQELKKTLTASKQYRNAYVALN